MRKVVGRIESALIQCRRNEDNSGLKNEADVVGIEIKGRLLDHKNPYIVNFSVSLDWEETWQLADAAGAKYLPGEIVGKHILLRYYPEGEEVEYIQPMYS